jgi:hypothetical protein
LKLNLQTVLAAAQAGLGLVPEGAALFAGIKALFGDDDAAAIEAALQDSRALRDAQHQHAQDL